jgi:hypothetical protein
MPTQTRFVPTPGQEASADRALPHSRRLPHGFGCVAVENVNDVEALTGQLAAIAEDPAPALDVGAPGREFACLMQRNVPFPQEQERALAAAAAGRRLRSDVPPPSGKAIPGGAAASSPSSPVGEGQGGAPRFPLCRLAQGRSNARIGPQRRRSGHRLPGRKAQIWHGRDSCWLRSSSGSPMAVS